MKFSSKKREQGSILAVALFTGLAIGIVLASFLTLNPNMSYLVWDLISTVASARCETV